MVTLHKYKQLAYQWSPESDLQHMSIAALANQLPDVFAVRAAILVVSLITHAATCIQHGVHSCICASSRASSRASSTARSTGKPGLPAVGLVGDGVTTTLPPRLSSVPAFRRRAGGLLSADCGRSRNHGFATLAGTPCNRTDSTFRCR